MQVDTGSSGLGSSSTASQETVGEQPVKLKTRPVGNLDLQTIRRLEFMLWLHYELGKFDEGFERCR